MFRLGHIVAFTLEQQIAKFSVNYGKYLFCVFSNPILVFIKTQYLVLLMLLVDIPINTELTQLTFKIRPTKTIRYYWKTTIITNFCSKHFKICIKKGMFQEF